MKKKHKIILAVVIGVCIILSIVLLLRKNNVYEKQLFYMDTYIELKIYTPKKEKEMEEILEGIEYLYSYYHKLTDRYQAYDGVKNVYYLNEELENNVEVEIDPLLANMILYGIEYYEKTNGYFNIALGNVTDIWKTYRESGEGVPTDEELSHSGSISIEDIVLKNHQYLKKNSVKLDLGGYAKGYVTQLVGEFLEENKIDKYIINAGGNVKVGKAYDKDFYQIGIEDPTQTNEIYKIINVEEKSIVTSGDYQRYYDYQGNRYSHIINPKTLYPESDVHSITVITSNSAYADIMSTYLYLISLEERKKVLEENREIDAIWYNKDNTIEQTKGLESYE